MFRRALPVLLLALIAAPAVFGAGGVNGWTRLKLGMMPVETAATLGDPLIRSASKGFELWIYDGKAEVLFFAGPVVAWTPPSGARAIEEQIADPVPAVRPSIVVPPPRSTAPVRNQGGATFDQLPVYRFRRRQ